MEEICQENSLLKVWGLVARKAYSFYKLNFDDINDDVLFSILFCEADMETPSLIPETDTEPCRLSSANKINECLVLKHVMKPFESGYKVGKQNNSSEYKSSITSVPKILYFDLSSFFEFFIFSTEVLLAVVYI